MTKKEDKKDGLITGGGVLIGLGVGFFLLEFSALFFVGSIMLGLGLGLIIEAFIARKKS